MLSTPAAHAGPDGEAVKAAELARTVALVQGDAPALAALLSDDLRYIHSTGKLETKRVVVEGIASKKVVYARMEATDLVADELTADVVALSGKIQQRKFGGGQWADLQLLFLAVWRREAGTWRLVNLQTVVPPRPAAP